MLADRLRRCRSPTLAYWPWIARRRRAQIAATALMLAAMGERSFVVTIAYIKTEPVQVAIFGLIFLGDTVTPLDGDGDPHRDRRRDRHVAQAGRRWSAACKPTLLGLISGAMFALSAIGYRGAILDRCSCPTS